MRGVGVLWLVGFAAIAGCTSDDGPDDIDVAVSFQVTSSAFSAGAPIPRNYACQDGQDPGVSPPLAFRGLPGGARTIAMIMDDPDAPGDDPFVHWVFWNLPSTAINLAEGANIEAMGGTPGANGAGTEEYFGPCPPEGETHPYFFKVYALDGTLDLAKGEGKQELLDGMAGRVLARGELMGTYASS